MADWSQSAAGLGQVFGKFMSGRDRFDDGMLQAAKIRKEQADALAGESKNSYIRSAIDAATAGNFPAANAYSVYGGAGKSGFDAASNGTVLNTITGGLDTGSSHAQAFANKLYQDAMAKQAQGMQYLSAAGLNDARAGQMAALTPYEQQKLAANTAALMGQAQQYYTGAQDNLASAAYRDQQRMNSAAMLPYDQLTRTAQAQNSFGGAARGYAAADQVAALTPYEQALKAGQIQGAFAGAERDRAGAVASQAQAQKYLADVLAAQPEMDMGGDGPPDQPQGPGFFTNRAVDAMGMIPGMQFAAGSLRDQLNAAAQPAGAGQLPADVQQQAQAAIAAGADPAKVMARLQQMGYGGM